MKINNNNRCILNNEVIEKCQSLYRKSNLEVVEYLASVLPNSERVIELAEQYKNAEDACDEFIIFWELMIYLGLDNKLK